MKTTKHPRKKLKKIWVNGKMSHVYELEDITCYDGNNPKLTKDSMPSS
jgi:hypothetical protein